MLPAENIIIIVYLLQLIYYALKSDLKAGFKAKAVGWQLIPNTKPFE